MIDKKGSSIPTKKLDATAISPNFKQFYGELLKDAWGRIKNE
jgi:hypothetical protein